MISDRKYINRKFTNYLLSALLFLILGSAPAQEIIALEDGFKNPPISVRPKGYWCWVNGNFSLSKMDEELKEFKDKGMGGVDIWDVAGWVDPNGVIPSGPPFMSDESVGAIGYAVRKATELGLEVGLTISSSWNAGGSWTEAKDGVMGLFSSSVFTNGNKRIERELPFPNIPYISNPSQDQLIQITNSGLPEFYSEVAVLAFIASEDSIISGKNSVLDISEYYSNGLLNWNAPNGNWIVKRYVCAPTGQPLMRPSPSSNGLMIDHYSAEATRKHIMFFIDKLQTEIGAFKNTNLKYLYTDSYEANSAAWTPKLQQEFFKRNNYSLIPYLPVLDGYLVESKEVSERFLFDFKKALSDLIIENHYKLSTDICAEYGLGFIAEAGGPGPPVHNCPFEVLKSLGSLTSPRGEFWYEHPAGDEHRNELQIIKGPASAAHLYGQAQVEAEAFTALQLWQLGPGDLKETADKAFCEGLTRFIYHTTPHIPDEAGIPGWVYNFGTIINTTRAWWPKSRAFHDYIGRCSYMLQQGNFVGDALYYYGDRAPNFVKPKHIDPSLGFGYDYDIVNSDIILNRLDVRDGKLVLPHGQSYSVLVLPDEIRMKPEALEKIMELVKKGAVAIGSPPEKSYRLHQYNQRDMRLRKLADTLWDNCDGIKIKKRTFGEGQIINGIQIKTVLDELHIPPDVYSADGEIADKIDFIHRSGNQGEIYFLRNKTKQNYKTNIRFRVQDKIPEIWHPDQGNIRKAALFEQTPEGIKIDLEFTPFDAYFVVFKERKPADEKQNGQIVVKANGRYQYKIAHNRDAEYKVVDLPESVAIDGPWELRFPHGFGTPARIKLPKLISWTESGDEAVRHFSGVAVYKKTFDLTNEWLADDKLIQLDLGDVQEIADVFLNGKHVKTSWYPPFIIDITQSARVGKNYLVIEVANTLNNQLVLDAKRLPQNKRLNSNITKLPHAWMYPMAESPLLPSGLIGPVIVSCQKKIQIVN